MEANNPLNIKNKANEMVPPVFDVLLEPVKSFVEKQNENLSKHPGEALSYKVFLIC